MSQVEGCIPRLAMPFENTHSDKQALTVSPAGVEETLGHLGLHTWLSQSELGDLITKCGASEGIADLIMGQGDFILSPKPY